MGKYRKKPVVIEAKQYRGGDGLLFERWSGGAVLPVELGDAIKNWHLRIPTLEGEMRADQGDWIIRGVKGEFYPCKPDIFEATYEPVED